MELVTYDDITGDGSKHQLVTLLKIGGVAVSQANWNTKWWQAIMSTSTGVSRVGNVNVSSTNGIPIGTVNTVPNVGYAPPIAFATDVYPLDQVYVIIKSNDVLSFARAV